MMEIRAGDYIHIPIILDNGERNHRRAPTDILNFDLTVAQKNTST